MVCVFAFVCVCVCHCLYNRWVKDRRVVLVSSSERKKWITVRPLPTKKPIPAQFEVGGRLTFDKSNYLMVCHLLYIHVILYSRAVCGGMWGNHWITYLSSHAIKVTFVSGDPRSSGSQYQTEACLTFCYMWGIHMLLATRLWLCRGNSYCFCVFQQDGKLDGTSLFS